MEYKVDFDVQNFPFWSGAKDRTDGLTYDQLEELGRYIEQNLDNGDGEIPTDTEINDFVWFECDDFLEDMTADWSERAKDKLKEECPSYSDTMIDEFVESQDWDRDSLEDIVDDFLDEYGYDHVVELLENAGHDDESIEEFMDNRDFEWTDSDEEILVAYDDFMANREDEEEEDEE